MRIRTLVFSFASFDFVSIKNICFSFRFNVYKSCIRTSNRSESTIQFLSLISIQKLQLEFPPRVHSYLFQFGFHNWVQNNVKTPKKADYAEKSPCYAISADTFYEDSFSRLVCWSKLRLLMAEMNFHSAVSLKLLKPMSKIQSTCYVKLSQLGVLNLFASHYHFEAVIFDLFCLRWILFIYKKISVSISKNKKINSKIVMHIE